MTAGTNEANTSAELSDSQLDQISGGDAKSKPAPAPTPPILSPGGIDGESLESKHEKEID